jgi:hypothetical protein
MLKCVDVNGRKFWIINHTREPLRNGRLLIERDVLRWAIKHIYILQCYSFKKKMIIMLGGDEYYT